METANENNLSTFDFQDVNELNAEELGAVAGGELTPCPNPLDELERRLNRGNDGGRSTVIEHAATGALAGAILGGVIPGVGSIVGAIGGGIGGGINGVISTTAC